MQRAFTAGLLLSCSFLIACDLGEKDAALKGGIWNVASFTFKHETDTADGEPITQEATVENVGTMSFDDGAPPDPTDISEHTFTRTVTQRPDPTGITEGLFEQNAEGTVAVGYDPGAGFDEQSPRGILVYDAGTTFDGAWEIVDQNGGVHLRHSSFLDEGGGSGLTLTQDIFLKR